MNDYFIEDKYNYKDIDYLYKIIDNALLKLNIKESSFTIVLSDDEEVRALNKYYRNIDKTTDVLSFEVNNSKVFPINILGDIIISIPQMKKQAKEYQTGEQRELAFLVIHGLLHLLGYDHETKEDEEIMFKLQEELLK